MQAVNPGIWILLAITIYVCLYAKGYVGFRNHDGIPRTRRKFLWSLFWSLFVIPGLICLFVDLCEFLDRFSDWLDKDTKL